jgi:serine/threonine protein kinase
MVKTVRYVGTIPYNAPEILAGNPNTFASDIYSLGLVIWELWYGEKVFKDLDDEQVKHPKRNPPRQKPGQIKKFRYLLNNMFDKIPKDRPTANMVVRGLKEIKRDVQKMGLLEIRYR